MRTRELTAGALLLFLSMIQMNAGPVLKRECTWCAAPEYETTGRVPERLRTIVIPEPTSVLVRGDEPLSRAYYDTMKILGNNNRCSDFYGGSEASVYVFSNLMANVKRAQLPVGIGVKMSGDYTNVLNAATQLKYRLFEKTSVNTAGPFYQRRNSASGVTVFGIGSFPPSTREARVLMLLHELGHLMRGTDGKWLLPDDGNSMEESLANTRKIEFVCGDQIRELDKLQDVELTRQDNAKLTVSPAAATSSH